MCPIPRIPRQPGRQYQADLAWLEDSSQLDRLAHIKSRTRLTATST
jgi:hypothetical protein